MKNFAAFVALACFAAVSFANDGTTSVLKNASEATTAQTVAQPTVAQAVVAQPTVVNATTAPVCCEQARVVKLSPWTVRRLNRVADRQEARDARNCCCKSSDDCSPKALVVESRRKTCNCR